MGGAQAVAALAYGTDTVRAVDVIAGPGNRYVQEAKRQVTGVVGIDGIAGPSELVVLADGEQDADALALDLLAQAEHGADGLQVLISPDAALVAAVGEAAARLAGDRPTVADAPLALVTVESAAAGLRLADAIAPEHLELVGAAERGARSERQQCRLRLRRPARRHRVRRLRRRFQPRPADRRGRALPGSVVCGHLPAPHGSRILARRGCAAASRRRARLSLAPRVSQSTPSPWSAARDPQRRHHTHVPTRPTSSCRSPSTARGREPARPASGSSTTCSTPWPATALSTST